MKRRKRPKTYEAEMGGKKVRVTVPDAVDEDVLLEAVKDNFSPQVVAAMANALRVQVNSPRSSEVTRQLRWLADRLTELVGGSEQYHRLCEEAGL